MKFKKIYQNFWFYPILLLGLSFLLTGIGWYIFDLIFLGKIQSNGILFLLFVICIWPILLLEKIGIIINTNCLNYISNAVGWFLLGIAGSFIRKKLRKNKKILTKQSS